MLTQYLSHISLPKVLFHKTVQTFPERSVPGNSRKESLGGSKNNTDSEKLDLRFLLITGRQKIHLSSSSFNGLACKNGRKKRSALLSLQGASKSATVNSVHRNLVSTLKFKGLVIISTN